MQTSELVRRNRPAEVVSLPALAALGAEELRLRFGLDALSRGPQIERARHLDDGAHERRVVATATNHAHGRWIDLEAIDRETPRYARLE